MTQVSLSHRLEYLAFRLVTSELLKLPLGAALRVAEGAGALGFRFLKGRTRVGRENLSAAFPELSPGEIDSLLLATYRNTFRLAGEVLYLRRIITRHTWRRHIELEGLEKSLDGCIRGRGGILLTGHLGNWELLSRVLPFAGMTCAVVARPLDNPLLERYILGVREETNQRVIVKRGSGAEIEHILSEGGFVGILPDQDAGRKGAFVPFLGRLASTWRSPALLSMKTGAPIIPGCCVRVGKPARFRVIVGEPIYPNPDATDVSAETLRITCAFTATLERWVRRYPEQYLWLHRRWKSRPNEKSLVARGGAI